MTATSYIRFYLLLNTAVLLAAWACFSVLGAPLATQDLVGLIWVMVALHSLFAGLTNDQDRYIARTAESAAWAIMGVAFGLLSLMAG